MIMTKCVFNALMGFSVFSIAGDCYAHNIHGETSLSFGFSQNGNVIDFSIRNESNSDVYIDLPIIETLDSGMSGVEYLVRDSKGVRYNLCANMAPISASERSVIKKGFSVSFTLKLEHAVNIYCLDPGKYKITAIYHHIVNGEIVGPDLVSNDIRFDFPLPD